MWLGKDPTCSCASSKENRVKTQFPLNPIRQGVQRAVQQGVCWALPSLATRSGNEQHTEFWTMCPEKIMGREIDEQELSARDSL